MNRISRSAEVALFKEFQDGNDDEFTKIFNQFHRLALSFMHELLDADCKHLQTDLESDINLGFVACRQEFRSDERQSVFYLPPTMRVK